MWFKFEDKIQNTSKAMVFTRNHADDNDDNGTKNNMSPLLGGGGCLEPLYKLSIATE